MQYPSGPGAQPNYFGAGKGGFQDGDETAGVPGTELQAALFNDWLGNVMHVLDAGGVAPTPGNLDDLKNAIANIAILFHGQCQLRFVSTVALVLAPFGGAYLRINGKTYAVPAAGLAIANTNVMVSGVAAQNLDASTAYLVFLCDDGAGHAIPDFWPVATGHMTDTTAGNVGVEVRLNGAAPDPTRTLVGMVATDGASHFSAFLTLSWFNRRDRIQKTQFGSDVSTSSSSLVELSSTIRNSFLVWAGEAAAFSFKGTATIGAGNDTAQTSIAFDGTAPEIEGSMYESFTGSTSGNTAFAGHKTGLTEGLHYATILGNFNIAGGGASSVATWYAATFAGCVLEIDVKG